MCCGDTPKPAQDMVFAGVSGGKNLRTEMPAIWMAA